MEKIEDSSSFLSSKVDSMTSILRPSNRSKKKVEYYFDSSGGTTFTTSQGHLCWIKEPLKRNRTYYRHRTWYKPGRRRWKRYYEVGLKDIENLTHEILDYELDRYYDRKVVTTKSLDRELDQYRQLGETNDINNSDETCVND